MSRICFFLCLQIDKSSSEDTALWAGELVLMMRMHTRTHTRTHTHTQSVRTTPSFTTSAHTKRNSVNMKGRVSLLKLNFCFTYFSIFSVFLHRIHRSPVCFSDLQHSSPAVWLLCIFCRLQALITAASDFHTSQCPVFIHCSVFLLLSRACVVVLLLFVFVRAPQHMWRQTLISL